MSYVEEDLTTDSVPDFPKDKGANDCANQNEKVKTEESSENKTKKTKKKDKNGTPPKCKPSMFKNPPTGMGPVNMICISNASDIHIGNSININIAQGLETSPSKPQSMKKPKEVKETLKSSEKVTLDDLDTVAEHVGKEWKKLGQELGYTDGQIERFHEDFHNQGLKEVVYKMLLDWKQMKSEKALVGILVEKLWKARCRDAAIELSKLRYPGSDKSL